MPARIISVIGLLLSFTLLSTGFIFAQVTPAVTGEPTCDLCGWCNKTVNPKPANYDACRTCLYDASGAENPASYFTVFGCISGDDNDQLAPTMLKTALNVIFAVSGGVAFLTFLHGASQVLTSSGDPIRLQAGKEQITSSLVGIFLIIFSVFLLRTVGFDILQIPGFG